MVGVGGGGGGGEGDDGSRRRLPSWMVNSDNRANSNDVLVKSESKTRRRTISTQRQEEEDDINIPEKKKKVLKPKGKKLKEIQTSCVHEIQDDNGNGNGNGNEEELTLTVEDLLSIAKEYVDCQRHSPNRDFDSEKQIPVPASSCEQSLLSVKRTGDPAEDMLDLFLGPLLKKPVQEEQNRTKVTANDMDIEFRMLSQTQIQKKNDAGQEHIVAPMKTKSSLKDKVAMLLD